MLKRFAMALMLALASSRAFALVSDYTDVYFNPAESGWGMFLMQSDTFEFIALFIYGSDSKPTWFTANVTQNGSSYTGPLYATTGTYYPLPWTGVGLSQVGTLTWTPTDIYHGTLSYTVNGVGTVTKTVQRQTLTAYDMNGVYSGGSTGNISNCADPANNDSSYRARWNMTATQISDSTITLAFNYVDTNHSGQSCMLTGPLTHNGRLYRVATGTATCTGPAAGTFPIVIDVLHPTGEGIEGRWTGTAPNGCTVFNRIGGVLNVNN
jgi:hypothetical protein